VNDPLAGLRCLVIGAASGIGRATVGRLKERVRGLVAADRPDAHWDAADRHRVRIDVTDAGSVASAVDQAVVIMGGLDVVVNTAGILGAVHPLVEESVEEFQRLIAVNLTGAFLVSKTVLPIMADAGFGRLVHFSSTAGKEGVAGMTGYSASKAGVMGLVTALAREYAGRGVTVNAIAPGKIATPLIAGHPASDADLARIPMGRLGTPEEAAALVAYVISPEASYPTGFVYDLSGGRATW
jgi:2-dehydro-3-deoxy-L-rhamnonate dehydrogenase (NAD+)